MDMEETFPYEIRWAYEQDWGAAISMVWKTFLKYEGKDYSKEAVQHFHDFLNDEKLRQSFLKGTYQMLVALDGSRIIGVAAVRYCNYVSLLFVDEEYHRKGIGKTLMRVLCRYLKEEAGEKYVSLTAAPCAVNFYRKLGFRAVCPEEEYAGVRVTAMEKIF